jgi:ABC-type lipoprotein export system ATPase subunit
VTAQDRGFGAPVDAESPSVVVECRSVGRTFGSGVRAVQAVTGINCRVPLSARIALTGPSGSGKSTLLHLIAGIDTPTTGTVCWPALTAHGWGRPGARIGVVFQGPSLLPSFDVVENVALPMLFAGCCEDTAAQRAVEALQLVGMGDSVAKLPDELSGGQSQRVAIARVLAARPALILADEPTGQLDHDTGRRVIAALLDTATAIDAALIVSTHDPVVAGFLADRWTMRAGRLRTSVDTEPTAP